MSPARLSALDASFLAAETPTAHMHVGWAAAFDPPTDDPRPSFEQLRDHIAARLDRAPRYRQRLAPVPLGVHEPLWVDDPRFDIDRHVLCTPASDLREVADLAMSSQLERSRPLWEMWIADRLRDGRIGVVGKAHHCMVDGIAAVELASLLLDPQPDPEPVQAPDWQPEPQPERLSLLAESVVARVRGQLELFRLPASFLASPRKRVGELAREARRAALALGHAVGTPAPRSLLNERSSALRHLGTVVRPLDELRAIKSRYGTTLNDVLLAVSAGAMRRFQERHGHPPIRLKTMVPVSLRETGAEAESEFGNRISFIFIELPCNEPDPLQRLYRIHSVMSERKRTGEPQGADTVLKLASYSPLSVQRALTGLVTSPRTFNLVVSNIPGLQEPMYMCGCRLAEAYPVVPLAERHALSIGMTTIAGRACFGLYADRKSLPDVRQLADDLDDAIDELATPRQSERLVPSRYTAPSSAHRTSVAPK